MNYVFVYGTLKRGQPNNRLLGRSRFVGEAATKPNTYVLLDLGPFPAMRRAYKPSPPVQGEVWDISDDAHALPRLDLLEGEGSLYRRVAINVTLDDGQVVTAWAYEIINGERINTICAEGKWPC